MAARGPQFAQRSLTPLGSQLVWLFSVGSFGERKPLIGPLMRREPKGITQLEQATQARDYRVFAGVIDRRRWPLPSRLFYHAFGGHFGDNRDWAQIGRVGGGHRPRNHRGRKETKK